MTHSLPQRLAMTVFATALAACSQTPEPAADGASDMAGVIAARQENFKQMKEANDAIKREAEADSPDPAVFRQNAAILVERAANIAGGFPEGSGPQEGVETDALPQIWQNKPQFEARATAMQDALAQFSTIAAGDDVNAMVAGVTLVGDTCRECHEEFRRRD